MRLLSAVVSAWLAVAPIAVFGADSYVQGYFQARSSFKLDYSDYFYGNVSEKEHGSGFGLGAQVKLAPRLAARGEYQSADLGSSDYGGIGQTRAGIGFMADGSNGLFVDYQKVSFSGDLGDFIEDMDGIGIHARFGGQASSRIDLYADIGYLLLKDDRDDVEGLEYNFGIVFKASPPASFFIDYRATELEPKGSSDEGSLTDIRLGIQIGFDV